MTGIDEREGPTRRTGERSIQVEPEAVEDRGHDVGRFDRSIGRHRTNWIAAADHSPALHSAAGEVARETLRPMIAAAGRIHAWRAAKLGQVANERRIEHAALIEVFNEG